jgi:hypothetical protein
MRSLIRVLFVLLLAAAALGQSRFGGFGGAALGQGRFVGFGAGFGQPALVGGFGNAVFPGGTPQNSPNVTRFMPNAVFPGGGGPRLVIPGRGPQRYTGFRGSGIGSGIGSGVVAVPFAYPVYVGGGYDDPSAQPPAPEPQPQQPSTTVIFPPSPAPVIAKQYADGNAANPGPDVTDAPPQTDSPEHYLIALKDHTVYPVLAYWVEGDTLHYFMPGNVHNQVSLALVDQPLTIRLNHELGVDVKLPDGK